MIRYDMIYLLTAIGLTAGDRGTVHIYTHTNNVQNKAMKYTEQHDEIRRTTQNTQNNTVKYTEQHNEIRRTTH
jgi:hypothetical protein